MTPGAPAKVIASTMGLGAFGIAIIAGLAVDLTVRLVPERRRAHAAGAGMAVAVVLSAAATVVVTAGMGWSPTLLLGVAFAAGAAGWGLAGLIRPRRAERAEAGTHPGTAATGP
ncbi:MAG TPA: hypothetical protein VK871_03000 [Candidatus Limnocylindrales bacterium]|nr:hypothetical protein [Candidatus Limnocylindrales bacterium]